MMVLFRASGLGDKGMGLWWIPSIINPCSSEHLRPIMVDDTRLVVANVLTERGLRPTPKKRKNAIGYTNYNNLTGRASEDAENQAVTDPSGVLRVAVQFPA